MVTAGLPRPMRRRTFAGLVAACAGPWAAWPVRGAGAPTAVGAAPSSPAAGDAPAPAPTGGATGPAVPAGPLWQAGRPTPLAMGLSALLGGAADQGLVPEDYNAAALGQALQAASRSAPLPAAAAERLQAWLLASLRRCLTELHEGRVDGRALFKHAGGQWPRPAWSPDALLAPLQTTLASGAPTAPGDAAALLATLPAAAWPATSDYAALQARLPPLRALIGHPAWAVPLPPAGQGARGKPANAPVPGDTWPGWPAVAQRLRVWGDLVDRPAQADPNAATATQAVDAAAVTEALRAFQQRHGLAVDGVPGPATRAALDTPPAARAAQLALTLERLRWRPQPAAERWLFVNLPAFEVKLVERIGGRPQACATVPVIVGQARGHATPQLLAEVQAIEFSPFWNVPPSIARQELVPQLRRDPAAAARLGYEAVLASGQIASAADPAVLDAVLAGRARLRQRPGEHNALGSIKFVFPNPDNVYLHHTPSVGLFERARRDFSHGCVRVQDPLAVAMFLLRDQPDWPADRVQAAMAGGTSRTLRLLRPVPIVIAHETAFVGDDGRLNFRADLYGLDAALGAALRQRTHGRGGPP